MLRFRSAGQSAVAPTDLQRPNDPFAAAQLPSRSHLARSERANESVKHGPGSRLRRVLHSVGEALRPSRKAAANDATHSQGPSGGSINEQLQWHCNVPSPALSAILRNATDDEKADLDSAVQNRNSLGVVTTLYGLAARERKQGNPFDDSQHRIDVLKAHSRLRDDLDQAICAHVGTLCDSRSLSAILWKTTAKERVELGSAIQKGNTLGVVTILYRVADQAHQQCQHAPDSQYRTNVYRAHGPLRDYLDQAIGAHVAKLCVDTPLTPRQMGDALWELTPQKRADVAEAILARNDYKALDILSELVQNRCNHYQRQCEQYDREPDEQHKELMEASKILLNARNDRLPRW